MKIKWLLLITAWFWFFSMIRKGWTHEDLTEFDIIAMSAATFLMLVCFTLNLWNTTQDRRQRWRMSRSARVREYLGEVARKVSDEVSR